MTKTTDSARDRGAAMIERERDSQDSAKYRDDLETAVTLLRQCLFLCVNGERPPGAPQDDPEAETWRKWNRDAETFVRGQSGEEITR